MLWRLFSLVLGVAMVGFLIREFNRPQVAAQVDQAMAVAVRTGAEPSQPRHAAAIAPADPAQFRKLLALAGWDAKRFAALARTAAAHRRQRATSSPNCSGG